MHIFKHSYYYSSGTNKLVAEKVSLFVSIILYLYISIKHEIFAFLSMALTLDILRLFAFCILFLWCLVSITIILHD